MIMKTLKIILFISISFIMLNCSTVKDKQAGKDEPLADKVENVRYEFKARSANPMEGRTIQLTPEYYSLKVSKDTIKSYLPYYGRAYTAPISPGEDGIKFTSTDFDYGMKESKNGWEITITTKDAPQKISMYLDIGKGGYATLSIQDNNRQSISFYGTIE